MLPKASVALIALFTCAAAACSDDPSSSASTAARLGSVEATTPVTQRQTPVSPPSGAAVTSSTGPDIIQVDPPQGTGVSPPRPTATGAPSTQVVATTAPRPTATTAKPAPKPSPTTTRLPPPTSVVSSSAKLADTDCTSTRSGADYDLLHMSVESLASRYRLIARYSGDTFRHDILVTFDLSQSAYLVTAELFEDGTPVARLSKRGSDNDDPLLDSSQVTEAGLVDLTVTKEQLAGISATPFPVTVSLKVDGSDIETCTPG